MIIDWWSLDFDTQTRHNEFIRAPLCFLGKYETLVHLEFVDDDDDDDVYLFVKITLGALSFYYQIMISYSLLLFHDDWAKSGCSIF